MPDYRIKFKGYRKSAEVKVENPSFYYPPLQYRIEQVVKADNEESALIKLKETFYYQTDSVKITEIKNKKWK